MDISPQERNKYAEIFQANNPINGYLLGAQARNIFLNSGLPVGYLEQIWDLSDIDHDGQLDFDEFVVAMRLTYALLNGEIQGPPASLPMTWIPQSKTQFLGHAQRQVPLQTGIQQQQFGLVQPQPTGYIPPQQQQFGFVQPQPTGFIPPQHGGQTYQQQAPDFDWSTSPQDNATYEGILQKYSNVANNGKLRFQQMEDFFGTLPLSKEVISQSWSLVDVNHTGSITHPQLLTFLHVLYQLTRGARLPSSLPANLKSSFAGRYASDLEDRPGSGTGARKGTTTSMSASASLADSYATRMGVASTLSARTGASADVKYGRYDEEEFLRKELEALKEQVRSMESSSFSASTGSSSSSYTGVTQGTVKSQLQALYDFKLKRLTEAQDIETRIVRQEKAIVRERRVLREMEEKSAEVRTERRRLEGILEGRKAELERVRREIQVAR